MWNTIPGAHNLSVCSLLILLVSFANGQGSCFTPNGQNGFCVRINECQFLLDILSQFRAGQGSSQQLNLLRRSICRFQNIIPFVCCPAQQPQRIPQTTVQTVTQQRQPSPSGSFATQQQPQPVGASSTCGRLGIINKIVGGENAELGEWPWIALLVNIGNVKLSSRSLGADSLKLVESYFDTNSAAMTLIRAGGRQTNYFCGGVLVSENYVLTAAHCIDSRAPTLSYVRLGEHQISSSVDCNNRRICAPPPQNIPVSELIPHPSHNSPCRACNDIGLIRLSRSASIDHRFVLPICLPRNPEQEMGFGANAFQGKVGLAAGWGSVSQDPNRRSTSDILQQVKLRFDNSHSFCSNMLNRYPDGNMILCAGDEKKDTCRGDSGGPISLTDTFARVHFIVGITSLGPVVCGASNTQGVYTNVHYYIPWITQNMRN